MTFDIEIIKSIYNNYGSKLERVRTLLNRHLTATEKILFVHLYDSSTLNDFVRGNSYVEFRPDRVAMQDATAQMALLQFMQAGKTKSAVPTTVHCDHLVVAREGAANDLTHALNINNEVYDFLSGVSNKYGIGFWKPGAGIIHQTILENYAFPGSMMIGTDSHTVNAGGLGMIAIGVGGADAVDVMTGMAWELRFPKIIGVKLTGKLSGWASAKDVILKLAGLLTVKGGTGYIVEYFGEGAASISCTGKATICNMGAEIGATTSLFGYDRSMYDYLAATGREEVAKMSEENKQHLTGDAEVYSTPEKYFDKVIEINLSELEPHINGPFTPDLATPLSQFADAVKKNGWPDTLSAGLIGSCTNSSYEDIMRAASIAQQAQQKNLKPKSELYVSPGSEQVKYTTTRDGFLDTLRSIGAVTLANACGPCIGQWMRNGAEKQEQNSIMTSFNRNFAKRADGNPNTHAFIASPEIITAFVLSGSLNFNPVTDTLINESGEQVKLDEPSGMSLPTRGFEVKDNGYQEPAKNGGSIEIKIASGSERLQILKPFDAWDGKDFLNLNLLIKVKGKCTTDHISMAGKWLRFRGHLENISNNLLIGAVNYFNEKTNCVKNQITGQYSEVPEAAKSYKQNGKSSIIIGDENYGEGSSREHAAMEPRFLGVKAVLVRSFARIHETNLKKQGVLALTFSNKEDYNKISEDDNISISGLNTFAPDQQLTVTLHHADGTNESFTANHSYNFNQIEWFKAGSALNLIRSSSV